MTWTGARWVVTATRCWRSSSAGWRWSGSSQKVVWYTGGGDVDWTILGETEEQDQSHVEGVKQVKVNTIDAEDTFKVHCW